MPLPDHVLKESKEYLKELALNETSKQLIYLLTYNLNFPSERISKEYLYLFNKISGEVDEIIKNYSNSLNQVHWELNLSENMFFWLVKNKKEIEGEAYILGKIRLGDYEKIDQYLDLVEPISQDNFNINNLETICHIKFQGESEKILADKFINFSVEWRGKIYDSYDISLITRPGRRGWIAWNGWTIPEEVDKGVDPIKYFCTNNPSCTPKDLTSKFIGTSQDILYKI